MRTAMPVLLVAALGTGLPAQAPSEEFLHLEPVLQAAMKKVAPSVVTIETFGGTRKI